MKKNIWEYKDKELDKLKDREFIIILNQMTHEIYNDDYYERFDYDNVEQDHLKHNYKFLCNKYKLKNPVEEYNVDSEVKGKNFIDIWKTIWDNRITQQSETCTLYALCAMSQIFKDIPLVRGAVKDDLRIHLCNIAPTATGKSEGNNMLIEFCNNSDFTYSVVGEFSPATLVGTINKSTVDANNIMKAREGDDEWRDPSQVGMLGDSHFIMFDEGEAIMHTTPRTEGSQQILQKAMNRYNSAANLVSNRLVNGTVEYNPNCSVIITSFYQTHFKESLLDRGMLQRMIIFYKDESDVNRVAISDYMYDGMEELKAGETSNELFDRIDYNLAHEKAMFEELRKETNKLRIRHTNTRGVVLDVGVKERFKEKTHELRNVIPEMTPYQNGIWQTLISRVTPTFMKIAAIYALMDYRDTIETKDVDKAAAMLQTTMQSVAIFMIGKISSEKTTDIHLPVYKKLKSKYNHKKMVEVEWINTIINVTGVGFTSATKLVGDLKASKKLLLRTDINTNEKKFELV